MVDGRCNFVRSNEVRDIHMYVALRSRQTSQWISILVHIIVIYNKVNYWLNPVASLIQYLEIA